MNPSMQSKGTGTGTAVAPGPKAETTDSMDGYRRDSAAYSSGEYSASQSVSSASGSKVSTTTGSDE